MKNIYFSGILFFFFLNTVFSQSTNKYTVFFTDKNNSPYSISDPSAYLSERAILRRAKQNISIQENDLPPNPNYIQQVINSGATYFHQSRWFNAITVSIPDDATLAAIQSLPFVQKVTGVNLIRKPLPIDYIKTSANNPPNKKSGLTLLNDVYSYGQSLTQVQQVGGVCMHNLGYDGKNMVICVLDAGYHNADVLSCFDSLWANNQILGTWDFVANDSSVYEDADHGAMVLSCMGANLPGQLIGTSPKASYWLLRTEEVATELIVEESNWAAGAEFADSVGADIINSSLGYTTFDVASQNHTWADLDGNTAIATIAADIAASKGILVCNSAGNEGGGGWQKIGIPADADSIVTVAAVDAAGVRAGFSSIGLTADGRIKPDVAAMGSGTSVIAPWSGTVIQSNGTSFSSPLTAGMAACLWQANPTKTNMQVINAMRSAGNQVNNPDSLLGWGIPNYCSANAILNGSAGISIKESDEILNIFYDPADESFGIYFYSQGDDDLQISVFDLSGKKLLDEERSVTHNTINFYRVSNAGSLAKGIYIIKIKSSGKSHAKKILKY